MSLFRRPKKGNIQRRVFSALDEDDEENTRKLENEVSASIKSSRNGDSSCKLDVDERCKTPPPPNISHKHEKKLKDPSNDKKSSKKTSLLSFGDEGKLRFSQSEFACEHFIYANIIINCRR